MTGLQADWNRGSNCCHSVSNPARTNRVAQHVAGAQLQSCKLAKHREDFGLTMKKSFQISLMFVVCALFGCRDSNPTAVVSQPAMDESPTTVIGSGVEQQSSHGLVDIAVDDDGQQSAGHRAAHSDTHSVALTAFLAKFDVLSAQGFVPTLRSGSTGIGYTLETMLQIEENNSPRGDFMGMELKAFRDDDLHMDDAEKMNLFLKEPAWIDGLKHADRVRRYGYIDDDGRQAMYSTVQIKQNSHGFQFRIDDERQRVYMQFKGEDIAFWTFAILEKRLVEKHSEAVFVAAHARGKGKLEEFHYYAVTWCSTPDVTAFVELIRTADVMLELRMHIKESGSVRNHGSAFRIKQNRIPKLYGKTIQVRPK